MKDDGGPAFPTLWEVKNHGWSGMSLLDYLAGTAPRAPGSFVRRYCGYDGNANLHEIKESDQLRADAAWSYKWAAARLAESKRRKEKSDEPISD